jgi:hypothetical protein
MYVVEYLKTHSLDQLKNDHGILVTASHCGYRLHFKYDQIFSRLNDEIADECNGLIIRHDNFLLSERIKKQGNLDLKVGDVKVVCRPLNRIYDFNRDEIEWFSSDLKISEKLDGLTFNVFYDKQWRISTSTSLDASNKIKINANDVTALDFFNTIFGIIATRNKIDTDFVKALSLKKGITYTFIVTSPLLSSVVKHKEHYITLVSAYENCWLDIRDVNLGPCIKKIKYKTIGEILETLIGTDSDTVTHDLCYESIARYVEQQPIESFEGFVINDGYKLYQIRSTKWMKPVKNVKYTKTTYLTNIILGKFKELLPLLDSSTTEEVIDLKNRYDAFCIDIDASYVKYKKQSSTSNIHIEKLFFQNSEPEYCFRLLGKECKKCKEALKKLLKKKELYKLELEDLLKQLEDMIVDTSVKGKKTFLRVTRGPQKRLGFDFMSSIARQNTQS